MHPLPSFCSGSLGPEAFAVRARLCRGVVEQDWAQCRSLHGDRCIPRSFAFPPPHTSQPSSSSLGTSTGGCNTHSSTCPNTTRGLHPPSAAAEHPEQLLPAPARCPNGAHPANATQVSYRHLCSWPCFQPRFGQLAASPHTDNPTSNHCMMEASILFFLIWKLI